MKLEMNHRKREGKKDYTETKQQATKKSMSKWGTQKKKLKNTLRWTLKTQPYEIYEIQQKQNWDTLSSLREVQSDTGLSPKTRKTSNNNLTYHLKELEKEEQTKPSQQKEVNNKD